MIGVVEVFMRVLLIKRDWIHVVPQVSSHLAEVHIGDPEDGVQRVQADAGHCQVPGVQEPGSVSTDVSIEQSDNIIEFHGNIIDISNQESA